MEVTICCVRHLLSESGNILTWSNILIYVNNHLAPCGTQKLTGIWTLLTPFAVVANGLLHIFAQLLCGK